MRRMKACSQGAFATCILVVGTLMALPMAARAENCRCFLTPRDKTNPLFSDSSCLTLSVLDLPLGDKKHCNELENKQVPCGQFDSASGKCERVVPTTVCISHSCLGP